MRTDIFKTVHVMWKTTDQKKREYRKRGRGSRLFSIHIKNFLNKINNRT